MGKSKLSYLIDLAIDSPTFANRNRILFKLNHLSAKGFDGATDPNAKPLVRPMEQDFESLKITHEDISAGNVTMTSRLTGNELVGTPKSSSLLVAEQLLSLLNEEDQLFLSKLYAGIHNRNEDLSRLDNIAVTIAGYRLMSKTP